MKFKLLRITIRDKIFSFFLGLGSLYLLFIGQIWLAIMFIFLAAVFFIQTHKRFTFDLPVNEKIIVSPISGEVVAIQNVNSPKNYDLGNESVTCISINLEGWSLIRSPVTGTILEAIYQQGFCNAIFGSSQYEKSFILLQYEDKKKMLIQMSGYPSEDIWCTIEKGQKLHRGDELGGFIERGYKGMATLAKNTGHIQIYFDDIIEPLVHVGQKVRIGETAIYEI